MYNETIHWSALTDGRTKYVFSAHDGSEQLFNLTADPGETFNLAGSDDTDVAAELAVWRARLAAHLAPRGERWVDAQGRLVAPRDNVLYGPNYPDPPPTTGDAMPAVDAAPSSSMTSEDTLIVREKSDSGGLRGQHAQQI